MDKELGMSGLRHLADAYLDISGQDRLTAELIDEVNRECDRIEDSSKDSVLLVLLRADRDGAPVGEPWPHDTGIHMVNQWERALRRIERLPGASLAVVEGDCTGLALETLLVTDHRVAVRGARLRIAATGENAWPGMALYRLANQVSAGLVRGFALFGAELPAERAVEWGLLDALGEDPDALARAALDRLGGRRGKEVALRRRLLLDATTTSFEDALGAHLAACDRALRLARSGPDAAEGGE